MMLALSCAVALALPVPEVPRSDFADTEASTNVTFCAGGMNDRLFRFSLELDASVSNNVAVAFGTDGDANGVLDREEADVLLGWDSGAWFFSDRRAGMRQETPRSDGRRCLYWRLTLRPDRTAKALLVTDSDGAVFTNAVPPTLFDPSWNLMQVTARGLSDPDGIVVAEVTGWGFKVILR